MLLDIMQPIFSCQNKVNPDLQDSSVILYVEVGQYHLAFFTTNPIGDIFTEYELFNTSTKINADTVVEFIKNSNVFKKEYKKIVFVHHAKESVLIPLKMFVSGTESSIIGSIHGDTVTQNFFTDVNAHPDIVNVFAIDQKITAACNDLLSPVVHTHINSISLKEIVRREKINHENSIDMIFYPSSFHMIIVNDGALQFMQTFYFETEDDVLYYLQSAIHDQSLTPSSLKARVCGFIKEDSLFMSAIRQHAPHVEFQHPHVKIFIPCDTEVPLHYFTPLFISTQCESSVAN